MGSVSVPELRADVDCKLAIARCPFSPLMPSAAQRPCGSVVPMRVVDEVAG